MTIILFILEVTLILVLSIIGFYTVVIGTKKEREEREFRRTHKRTTEPIIENGKMIGYRVIWTELGN